MYNENAINSLSDEEVVALAQQKDRLAMDVIISRYINLVKVAASKYYISGYDFDDIVQEGMIALYRAIITYKPDKSMFRTFAILCITRKIVSVLKSTKRQKDIPLNFSVSLDKELDGETENYLLDCIKNSDIDNPESIIISNENVELYEKIIKDTLSNLEYNVFGHYAQGASYKEISKILNKDVKCIDNAVQRIKNKLIAVVESYL